MSTLIRTDLKGLLFALDLCFVQVQYSTKIIYELNYSWYSFIVVLCYYSYVWAVFMYNVFCLC